MGHGCPVSVKLLCLAMVLAPRTFCAGQQTAPPTSPPPPATSAAQAPAPANAVPDFHDQSLSHVTLQRGDRTFDVYLFAPDQNAQVVSDSFCGGEEGSKQYTGHYQLISVENNGVISRLNLDPDTTFVEKRVHDGARAFHDAKSGQNLLSVYQYGSCNAESVEFFSVDPAGHLFQVPFLDKDGRTWKQALTGPKGAIPHFNNGAAIFCSYANDLGYTFCEAYAFDGANFQEGADWMTEGQAEPVKGLNEGGVAERILYDFLTALAAKAYAAAAYYVDAHAEIPGGGPPPPNRGQWSAYLEKYCTVMGGQCLMPSAMKEPSGADPQSPLPFQVSFLTADLTPFRIGERSSFDFRVARTADGPKVLDLPPRLP